MDQQYSITLGRPLGISSIGDCPPPRPASSSFCPQDSLAYCSQITILARQIFSTAWLRNSQIDELTDRLSTFMHELPSTIRFDSSWLGSQKLLPHWSVAMQAASLHQKLHNLLVLLNRQRAEGHEIETRAPDTNAHGGPTILRGRQRVLASCREILYAFEFFRVRARAGLIYWTVCQQAFNAANILIVLMLEAGDTDDYCLVEQAYYTFSEIHELGIHRLAGAAAKKLQNLIKGFVARQSQRDTVMRMQGSSLLEHGISTFGASEAPASTMRVDEGDVILSGNAARPGATKSEDPKNKSNKSNKKVKLNSSYDLALKTKSSSAKQARKDLSAHSSINYNFDEEHLPSPTQSAGTSREMSRNTSRISNNSPVTSRLSIRTPPMDQPPTDLASGGAYSFNSSAHHTKSWAIYSPPSGSAYPSPIYTSAAVIPAPIHTPSLKAPSYPSSAYVSSIPSSSFNHVSVSSHPVSPTLSRPQSGHLYCLDGQFSQMGAQEQSPGWGYDVGEQLMEILGGQGLE